MYQCIAMAAETYGASYQGKPAALLKDGHRAAARLSRDAYARNSAPSSSLRAFGTIQRHSRQRLVQQASRAQVLQLWVAQTPRPWRCRLLRVQRHFLWRGRVHFAPSRALCCGARRRLCRKFRELKFAQLAAQAPRVQTTRRASSAQCELADQQHRNL